MIVLDMHSLELGLQAGLQELGLSLDPRQIEQVCQYAGLIAKWNKVYNLTALRKQESILTHHLLDCLAVIQPFSAWASARGHTAPKILDVGSGAGLPGLLIAICQADWEIYTIDTVGKKTAFMQQAAAQLQLKNVRVHHARVEELAARQATRFDLITSRAFSSLPDFLALSTTLLHQHGSWVAMKGKAPSAAEIAELGDGFHVERVQTLNVPQLPAERCLVWISRA
jgi:16S rRNA (guanine527-N7)-methyltransferase